VSTALEVYRHLPRYLALRAAGGRLPAAATVGMAPLRLADRPSPRLPGPGWVRVRPRLSGICGSDLATVTGGSSLYFSPLVSMPFTPGHEVVGDLLDDAVSSNGVGLPAGTRVVLDPVLSCRARGLDDCPACAAGATNRCARVTLGHVSPGLQTGYCRDTGGGWSGGLVAHASQLRAVPDGMPDERAVLAEPLACAVHVARRAFVEPGASVLVVGAGTVGLLVLHALRALTPAGRVTVVAKHPRQAQTARDLGADEVVDPRAALAAVRRSSSAVRLSPERGGDLLLGGVDVALECVGSSAALEQALRATRAGGRVVLAGMPASADLSPAWFRELEVVGSYASGGDDLDVALDLLADPRLAALRSSWHPLSRYREAIDEAGDAGRLGLAKVGFDLRDDSQE
jgi:threonine dehydrogenase-like Zn-dependent dehydrogenase